MWWWLTFFLAAVIWNAFTLEVLTDDRSKKRKKKQKIYAVANVEQQNVSTHQQVTLRRNTRNTLSLKTVSKIVTKH